jgi:hypothetical protein
MSCLSCASDHQAEFSAEMIIHVGGLKNLDNPGIWLFTKLLACLDCGFSSFTVPQAAAVLRIDKSTHSATASERIAPRART